MLVEFTQDMAPDLRSVVVQDFVYFIMPPAQNRLSMSICCHYYQNFLEEELRRPIQSESGPFIPETTKYFP